MKDYSEFSDTDLSNLLRSGDRMAFTEIYNRYKLVLHNHAWNKTGNREEAQDAIHEVFEVIWTKRETIQIGRNLAGYLYVSLRNHILNAIARKEVKNKYISSIQHFTEISPIVTDYLVRENLLKAVIEKEIANLPPKMREVFELSRKQHLSHKEIAEIMGTSEQTIKKQMTNALKVLRSKLGLINYILMFFIYR